MENGIEEANKPDRRIYPEEVVRNGGMTYIPNMILRDDMGIKPSDTKYLIYLLSKPMDWIYYHELIAEETGISLSTIYDMNKRLGHLMTFIPSGTGQFGTGFCINFSKLYARCVEIGVKEKIKKQEKEKLFQKTRESVQNLEIDLQKLEQSLWETTTTNTDTNIDITNTNLSMESDDRQSFYDKGGEEGSPPSGGCPNQQIDEKEVADELDYQKTDSKDALVTYIIDTQFQNFHYTRIKKLEMRNGLLTLPLSDLKLLIKYADTWHFWCEVVSTSHGLTNVKGSDHGLPLMLNKSIYAKFIKYINEIEHKEHVEQEKKRIELEVQEQKEKQAVIHSKKLAEINSLPWEERLKTLRSFRFDLSDFDFKPQDAALELIAKDDDDPLSDIDRYHKMLFKKYPSEMYNMEEIREMKNRITEFSEQDIVHRLKNFKFELLEPPVKVVPLYFDSYAKKKSINGDVELLYNILTNNFRSSFYKETIIDPDFEERLLASLNEDE